MSSFKVLVPLVIFNALSVFSESDVCIWNVIYDGGVSRYTNVNGLYEYQEQRNNRPMYHSNVGCVDDGIYLYFKMQNWYIGADPALDTDAGVVTGLRGKCLDLEIAVKDPSGCNDAWQIPKDDTCNDTDVSVCADDNIEVVLDKCPSWNDFCTEVSIAIDPAPSPSDNCDGTFAATTGYSNVYSKVVDDTTTMYWYFNSHAFQWICSDTVDFDTCQVGGEPQYSFSSTYWQDLVTTGITTVDLVGNAAMKVTCTKTPSPTRSPTKSPLQPGDGDGYDDGIGGNKKNAVRAMFIFTILTLCIANLL